MTRAHAHDMPLRGPRLTKRAQSRGPRSQLAFDTAQARNTTASHHTTAAGSRSSSKLAAFAAVSLLLLFAAALCCCSLLLLFAPVLCSCSLRLRLRLACARVATNNWCGALLFARSVHNRMTCPGIVPSTTLCFKAISHPLEGLGFLHSLRSTSYSYYPPTIVPASLRMPSPPSLAPPIP